LIPQSEFPHRREQLLIASKQQGQITELTAKEKRHESGAQKTSFIPHENRF
jgi:hypothetical protein